MEALRAGCLAAGQPAPFNDTLRELARTSRGDAVQGPFWTGLVSRKMALIKESEVPGGVADEKADAWLALQAAA